MSDEKFQDIALFRYRLIAPVLNDTSISQRKYFKQMSEKELEVPHLGKKNYKVDTFKSWLRDYRNGGFEALKPRLRADKGTSRKVDEHLGKIIKEKIEHFPFLSSSALYRCLISEGEMKPDGITEATLRKYIKDNNLKQNLSQPAPRKKFEKEHINELWIADCMHGPHITSGKKKKKIFLISIIDDCSRVIVGGRFFFNENSVSLEIILKEAMSRFGLPRVLYTDNGSLFVSSHLQLACARLGIALVHSKPYDSPSRGKIERFFRTVRQKFLPLVDLSEIESLEGINTAFEAWLDKEYQKSFHHGLNAKPMDKWMDDLKHTTLRKVAALELDLAFFITLKRKVKNDATISVQGICYEAPHAFIGKIIELRYPSDQPHNLTLYENNQPVCQLKKVNPIENANPPAWGIKFDQK